MRLSKTMDSLESRSWGEARGHCLAVYQARISRDVVLPGHRDLGGKGRARMEVTRCEPGEVR